MLIRAMTAADWPAVEAIWADGIATGDATFEPAPPSWSAFDTTRSRTLRLVAVDAARPGDPGPVLGWAAAGPVSHRRAYAGVVEHSVYVAPASRGRGVGRRLLDTLVDLAEATGTWTIRSGVFPENTASLALHSRAGFTRVGVLHGVGRGRGRWRDVVLIERRSTRVGTSEPLVRLALPDPVEVAAIERLLTDAGLPPTGLDGAWRTWVVDLEGIDGAVVGAVALERYPCAALPADDTGDPVSGDTGDPVGEPADPAAFLLRSLVVAPEHRGRRLGERLVHAALRTADLTQGHPATVCLLTETADGYVDRFGFAPVDRAALPAAVGASALLRGACPASSRAYLRTAAQAARGARDQALT